MLETCFLRQVTACAVAKIVLNKLQYVESYILYLSN